MAEKPDFKRLPRNAAPIPCPTSKKSDYDISSTFDNYVGSFPNGSPSVYSEFNVVLDDGTLQKRTVSLSTMPDDLASIDEEDYEDDPVENEDFFVGKDSIDRYHCDRKKSQETLNGISSTPLLKDKKKISYSSINSNDKQHDDIDSSTTSNEDSDSSKTSFHLFNNKKSGKKPNGFSKNWHKINTFLSLTPSQRLVLKCSFAYMLGSLFTFVPFLNGLIGYNHVSSHLVATATVFFNPAKTLGGMVEATLYGWGYVLFAITICFGSMITTDYFVDRNLFIVAYAISLGFWLSGATFIVAFLKAHWNKPPVATASSLCFIIMFCIIVKESSTNRGDFDTTNIQKITTAVAMGTLVTISCCVLFWPVSASKKLRFVSLNRMTLLLCLIRQDLEATLVSYKVLLKLLTKTFLLDQDLPEFKANDSLKTAIDSHLASFTSLKKSLQEAKFEVIWNDEIRGCTKEYSAVVKSMQRLAQSVGGLRSSCGLQFERMKQDHHHHHGSLKKRTKIPKRNKNKKQHTWHIKSDHHRQRLEGEIRRQRDLSYQKNQHESSETNPPNHHQEEGALIEFIHSIRQPLKSLAYTCKQTIIHLQTDFSSRPKEGNPTYETLKNNLVKAISLFEVSQRQAVKRLNRHRIRYHNDLNQSENYVPNEEAFLVYFFVFNMIEFAKELISLVESVQMLSIAKQRKRTLFRLIAQFFENKPKTKKEKHSTLFVPNERHKMDTLHTPVPKTKWRRIILKVWRAFSLFKLQKVRYATKATVAVLILALPAFLDYTGNWFRKWRMEWALITLMVVMTPTVGGTNLVAIYRIYSTTLGCFVAMCSYLLFPDNMYVLILVTWLFSIPNFWIIFNHKHGKFGQFTLLAYNLVMLNKYNDRETHKIEVTVLALQRCLSILVGVVFGLFATAYVWPYEARVELRKGVSDFLLRLGWLYQKLVSFYSSRPETPPLVSPGETLISQRQQMSQMFSDLELGLQCTLIELQELLKQTPNEPRLKGAFPTETYSNILISCQNITDKLSAMRTVILKDEWFEQVQADFILPVTKERREMVGNILLYFYVLASALRLKTPLPPYLPPARKAWESLILRLRQLPIVQSKELLEKDHVNLFYYVYVTVLEDIIRELDNLGIYMSSLFGSIVPNERWEDLFEVQDIEEQSLNRFSISNEE